MRQQIFCLPYAGGSADIFLPLQKFIQGSVEIVPIEYSGHGKRNRMPLYKTFQEMVDDVEAMILSRAYRDNPIRLFGYSMGSIVVYELLKRKKLNIEGVILAAHEPPLFPNGAQMLKSMEENNVKEKLLSLGGIDKKTLNNTVYWRVYYPIFKQDFMLLHDYIDEIPMQMNEDVNVCILYSEEDTPYKHMIEWQNYFKRKCIFKKFIGNHFFIKQNYERIAQIIENRSER